MTKATEIIMQVSKGDITVEQANAALKKQNAGFVLDPGKVTLTDEERAGAVVSDDPTKVTGWGWCPACTARSRSMWKRASSLIIPLWAAAIPISTSAAACTP
ncbi:MAG: hypothetical protein ACLVDB_01780 [Anaeromassilibacillus sp.]